MYINRVIELERDFTGIKFTVKLGPLRSLTIGKNWKMAREDVARGQEHCVNEDQLYSFVKFLPLYCSLSQVGHCHL